MLPKRINSTNLKNKTEKKLIFFPIKSIERKLRPNERPHLIYMQNFSNKNSATCIRMKKWYFNLKAESSLAKNSQTLKYLFHQVIVSLLIESYSF